MAQLLSSGLDVHLSRVQTVLLSSGKQTLGDFSKQGDRDHTKTVFKSLQMVIETSRKGVANMALKPRHVYYDGKIQLSHGNVFETINPATGEAMVDIHAASLADIDSAVQSAATAFPSWSSALPIARSRILLKAVKLLRERNTEIASIETADTGKPLSETEAVDVVTGADVLEYFAGLVASGGLNGETTQLREDAWIYTKKEPLGVCAGIGAWNYPIQM